jgi:hypothetical protein
MFFKKILIGAALLSASAAQAATVYADNFDTDTLALNALSFNGGWSVSGGTVDVIGAGGIFDLAPGNGRYIDLDGSSNNAGIFANAVSVVSGQTYTLSFDLAGNQRGAGPDTVEVNFGSVSQVYTRNAGDAFTTYTLSYTATSTGKAGFSFIDSGNDNQGALLDRVAVASAAAPVPEPASYGMLLGGLGLLGAVARSRRRG